MKRIFLSLLIIFMTSFFLVHGQETIPGEYIVRLDPGMEIGEVLSNQKGTALRLKRVLSSRMNIFLLGVEEGGRPMLTLGRLKKTSGVATAQFNHKVELRNGLQTIPSDSLFSSQWALNNTGQTGGLADADIDAVEAWDRSLGGQTLLGDTMVVAVIDDGFFLNHEDILYWKNKGEIPNNGIDDDQNGFVDDFDGWNAYEQNGQLRQEFHGTEVAGIIGGIADNGIGIAGVGWQTAIMPVMGLSASEATVVEAYDYILAQRLLYEETRGQKGAFVVATNASFGVDRGNPLDFPIWCGIFDVLGEAGILNVAATANSSLNVDQVGDIPTACTSDYLITVTSTDFRDQKVGGAAFGAFSIDMGAPGNGIQTTFGADSYGIASGTSFAAPMVAGVIPLLFAANCPRSMAEYLNEPGKNALKIREMILQGVDLLGNLNGLVKTGGRLNAANTLGLLDSACAGPFGSMRTSLQDEGDCDCRN